jgi:hypothetical protein
MKRYLKISMISVGVIFILFILIAVAPMFVTNYLDIAYNNECLQSALDDVTSIHIENKVIDPAKKRKSYTINEKEEMIWLIKRLRLKQTFSGKITTHPCIGHLSINIITKNNIFLLSYDHGSGMYPIARKGKSPSFVDMDTDICKEINKYFMSVGFSEEEIGI